MRIISGKLKGRRLVAPNITSVRPTTDFAKESIFNIINNHFYYEDINVLDLFAGYGSISYEFASRGSKHVTTVEINPKCVDFINSTIRSLKIETIKVLKANAFRYLENCKQQFDIIYADPPYDLEGIENIPSIIFEKDLLNTDGWLILEHSKMYHFETLPFFLQHRNYGKVNFSIFLKK